MLFGANSFDSEQLTIDRAQLFFDVWGGRNYSVGMYVCMCVCVRGFCIQGGIYFTIVINFYRGVQIIHPGFRDDSGKFDCRMARVEMLNE